MEATEHCGPLPEIGGKQTQPNFPQNHEVGIFTEYPYPVRLREETEFLCLFSVLLFLAGTLWITPEASYCLDALTAHRVVNPRPNPLQTTQPYRIFPARPTHSFHLSHRSGNLCRVSLFLFSVLFLHTIRNDRHGSAPGWPREPRLEQTSSR